MATLKAVTGKVRKFVSLTSLVKVPEKHLGLSLLFINFVDCELVVLVAGWKPTYLPKMNSFKSIFPFS